MKTITKKCTICGEKFTIKIIKSELEEGLRELKKAMKIKVCDICQDKIDEWWINKAFGKGVIKTEED